MLTTEKVWEEFSGGLKQFILKRIPDETQAEDVLQDVFLKIHTRIDSLRDQERLPAWVYQIARNTIYDFYRTRQVALLPHYIGWLGSSDSEQELVYINDQGAFRPARPDELPAVERYLQQHG